MLWRWIVSRVRVEVAFWQCYWGSRRRGDWWSEEYCARHSLLLWATGVVAVAVFCILVPLTLDGLGFLLRWLLRW